MLYALHASKVCCWRRCCECSVPANFLIFYHHRNNGFSTSRALTAERCLGVVRGYKGTLVYMAPEEVLHHRSALLAAQLSGNLPDDTYELDGRACDNFALGLVAYQFLTGHFPFPKLMGSGDYHNHFLALDKHAQLEMLAAAFQNWMVSLFSLCLWSIQHALLFKLAQPAIAQGSALANNPPPGHQPDDCAASCPWPACLH